MLGFFMMFWSTNLGFGGFWHMSIKLGGIFLGRSRASIKSWLTIISFSFTKRSACFYLMWYLELYGDLL